MALKIVTILLGLALLIGFIFFERRMSAFFKGRSKLFYVGVAAICVAAFVLIHTVDFIYILLALAALISLLAIAPTVVPWLVDKWYKR